MHFSHSFTWEWSENKTFWKQAPEGSIFETLRSPSPRKRMAFWKRGHMHFQHLVFRCKQRLFLKPFPVNVLLFKKKRWQNEVNSTENALVWTIAAIVHSWLFGNRLPPQQASCAVALRLRVLHNLSNKLVFARICSWLLKAEEFSAISGASLQRSCTPTFTYTLSALQYFGSQHYTIVLCLMEVIIKIKFLIIAENLNYKSNIRSRQSDPAVMKSSSEKIEVIESTRSLKASPHPRLYVSFSWHIFISDFSFMSFSEISASQGSWNISGNVLLLQIYTRSVLLSYIHSALCSISVNMAQSLAFDSISFSPISHLQKNSACSSYYSYFSSTNIIMI